MARQRRSTRKPRVETNVHNIIRRRRDRPELPAYVMLYLVEENLFFPMTDQEFLQHEFPTKIQDMIDSRSNNFVAVRCPSGPARWFDSVGYMGEEIPDDRVLDERRSRYSKYITLKSPYTGWFDIPEDKLDKFLGHFGTHKGCITRYHIRNYRSLSITRFRLHCDPEISAKLMNEYDRLMEVKKDIDNYFLD